MILRSAENYQFWTWYKVKATVTKNGRKWTNLDLTFKVPKTFKKQFKSWPNVYLWTPLLKLPCLNILQRD